MRVQEVKETCMETLSLVKCLGHGGTSGWIVVREQVQGTAPVMCCARASQRPS